MSRLDFKVSLVVNERNFTPISCMRHLAIVTYMRVSRRECLFAALSICVIDMIGNIISLYYIHYILICLYPQLVGDMVYYYIYKLIYHYTFMPPLFNAYGYSTVISCLCSSSIVPCLAQPTRQGNNANECLYLFESLLFISL